MPRVYSVPGHRWSATSHNSLDCALCFANYASIEDQGVAERFNELHLVNKWATGLAFYRLLPTQSDREAFFACVKPDASRRYGRVGQAYSFFRAQLTQPGPDNQPLNVSHLETVLWERFQFVAITADRNDNVHRIFESLNHWEYDSLRPTCFATTSSCFSLQGPSRYMKLSGARCKNLLQPHNWRRWCMSTSSCAVRRPLSDRTFTGHSRTGSVQSRGTKQRSRLRSRNWRGAPSSSATWCNRIPSLPHRSEPP